MAKIKYNILVIFTNQFAAMIKASLPLGRILDSLASENLNKHLLKVIRKVKASVENGVDLGVAVAMHPKVFDPIYVNMVKAGMETGRLDETLTHLSQYMEKSAETKSKVKSALTYPIFMFCFLCFVVYIMVFFILPMFEKMFANSKKELPVPTQILMQTADIIKDYWPLGLLLIVIVIIAIHYYLKTPLGRYSWDRNKLSIPLFGNLMKKASLAKFLRTFSTLIQSEVPIIDSLDLVSTSGDNKFLESKIKDVREMIERGMNITTAFELTRFFPETVLQMIASGEETGNLDKLLISAANFYDDQVDESLKSMVALINPVLTIVIGGAISMIMIAIFLPILQMGGGI